jgi:hypothetical protein
MPRRRSTGLPKRDLFGVAHGNAGKGDKTRVTNLKAYNENLAAIEFPHDNTGFERKDGKLVKRYGAENITVFSRSPSCSVH